MDFVSGPPDSDSDDNPKQTHSPSPVPCSDQPPEAPIMTYNWMDITEEFKHACQGWK